MQLTAGRVEGRAWVGGLGPVVAVAVAAVVLRVGLVLLVPNAQHSDSVWYHGAAERLITHEEYGVNRPSAWFPPGYSFFLAAVYAVTGPSELAGKLANVALGAAVAVLGYAIGRRLFGATVGLIAGLLLAAWPNLVFHTTVLASDVLATALFGAAFFLALRLDQRPVSWQVLALGLLLGWATLTRPVALILLPALALLWWTHQQPIRLVVARLAVITCLAGLLVGAWTTRNYLQFGELIPIATNGGYNFSQSNHRFADGNDTYWPHVPMDDPEYRTMWQGDEFTRNREGYRFALAYLQANPLHPLLMAPTKVRWLWHTDTSGVYEAVLHPPLLEPSPFTETLRDNGVLLRLGARGYYTAAMLVALFGALAIVRARQWQGLPLLALPVLLTAFHLFFHAKDRFHLPLLRFIAVLAAVGMVELWRWRAGTDRVAGWR